MRRIIGSIVLASIATLPAQAAPRCVSPNEAEALAAVALPEILRETGRVCAATLPPTALVRRGSGPFIAKYRAEADRAWPTARTALAKLSDPAIMPLLDSDFARPLLATLIAPQLTGRIDSADCATIDRFASLVEPLPAANIAAIVVTALRFLKAKKARNVAAVKDVPDLPICDVK